jgi:hypothetical protein
MPRKASKARYVTVVSRWLEWRCIAKWQYVKVIDTGHYRPAEREDLVDSFITEDGPPDREQIANRLSDFSLEELQPLAEIASRYRFLAQDGRPWQVACDPLLIADVEEMMKKPGCSSARDACERLTYHRDEYRRFRPEALRQRYLKAKKAASLVSEPLP